MVNSNRVALTYKPGDKASSFNPGDFGLTHAKGFVHSGIRFAQRIRFRGENRRYAYWNHVFIIIARDGTIVEALGNGIKINNISKYKNVEYTIISPTNPSLQMRDNGVAFAKHCAEDKNQYGFLTIANLMLWTLFGGKFDMSLDGTEICSQLAARVSERYGEIWDSDPVRVTPAGFARHFATFFKQ